MSNSEFIKRTDAAAELAAWTVVSVARQHGTPILVWVDGETIEIDPYAERRARNETCDKGNIEPYGKSPPGIV